MADIKRVIIDAGHGGEEPGALYDGRRGKREGPRAGPFAMPCGWLLQ